MCPLKRLRHELFRSHIVGSPHHHAGHGERTRAGELGNAEIGDPDVSTREEHDIRRLDVAMDDAVRMSVVERPRRRRDDAEDLAGRQRRSLARQQGVERLALDQFHHDVSDVRLFGKVENRNDIRMRQPRRRLSFPKQPFALTGRLRRRDTFGGPEYLDRHRPAEERIAGAIHLPHSAASDELLKFVPPKLNHGNSDYNARNSVMRHTIIYKRSHGVGNTAITPLLGAPGMPLLANRHDSRQLSGISFLRMANFTSPGKVVNI